ncbi:ABC transporter ATP-binding protein [Melghirimyces algeriensis]|uniref:ATP-binding cassette, subfamily B n=1 Tax=Melghirimyces algeriensis TaxID=910412 RepID=A0A521D1T3_9BACL|nr:ABC transporter ATP-binding protein [Melghirimyces algeriensis]SMO65646.1 ATP-binding cassette, subfamily B [Melghirimyces algeriensis]
MSNLRQVLKAVGYAFGVVWRTHKSYLFVTVTIRILLGLIPLSMVWMTKELINQVVRMVQTGEGFSAVLTLLSFQMVVILFGYALSLWTEVNDQKMDNLIGLSIKKNLLEKVNRLPFLTFEDPVFYDRFQRSVESREQLTNMVKQALSFGTDLITITSLVGYLMGIHWGLTVILIIGTLPVLMIDMRFGGMRYQLMRYLTPFTRKEQYLSYLLSLRDHLKEVRLFQLGDYLIREWSRIFRLDADKKLDLIKKQSRWNMAGRTFLTLTYAASGILVVFLIRSGQVLVGDLVAVLQSIQNVQDKLTSSTRTISMFYEGSFYVRDIEQFLNQKERTTQETSLVSVDRIREIEIEGLTFRYPNQKEPAIQDIHLDIYPGKKIAIIGENGSGKTTLIKCLSGLYELDSPMIRVNGLPLSSVDLASYHRRVAVLFQDYIRYNLTAKENIGFGRVESMNRLDEIEAAAAKTDIDRYLNQLPEGYESLLGRYFNKGNELSGGQWQKVALSRAWFRDSDVVILDEPTSALDPRSEIDIVEQLFRSAKDKAVIFITHRLGASSLADEILVMRSGKVVERGGHDELLSAGGEYSRLYRTQARWYLQKEESIG